MTVSPLKTHTKTKRYCRYIKVARDVKLVIKATVLNRANHTAICTEFRRFGSSKGDCEMATGLSGTKNHARSMTTVAARTLAIKYQHKGRFALSIRVMSYKGNRLHTPALSAMAPVMNGMLVAPATPRPAIQATELEMSHGGRIWPA
jgi:hypothetical protein